MPGDGPALLGMPDIELHSMFRVMCETIDGKTMDGKFETKTRYAADSQNWKINRDPQAQPDADSVSKVKTNMPDILILA